MRQERDAAAYAVYQAMLYPEERRLTRRQLEQIFEAQGRTPDGKGEIEERIGPYARKDRH